MAVSSFPPPPPTAPPGERNKARKKIKTRISRRATSAAAAAATTPGPSRKIRRRKKHTVVRVVGARIYDPLNGKTCHQCRQKTLNLKATCKQKECASHYCHKCLWNRYGVKAEETACLNDWICPRCRGVCNCSMCMKKRGHRPTGIFIHAAKANGFCSVSEMLHHKDLEVPRSEKTVGDDGKKYAKKRKKSSNKEVAVTSAKRLKRQNGSQGQCKLELLAKLVEIGLTGMGKSRNDDGAQKASEGDKNAYSAAQSSPEKHQVPKEASNQRQKLSKRDYACPHNVHHDHFVADHQTVAELHKSKRKHGMEVGKFTSDTKLLPPQGIEVRNLDVADAAAEDVGDALRFLEFCEAVGKEPALASIRNHEKPEEHGDLELQAEAFIENAQVKIRKKKVKKSRIKDANENSSKANSNADSLVQKEPAVARSRNLGKNEGCEDLELQAEALKENAQAIEMKKSKVKKSWNRGADENASRANSNTNSLVQKEPAVASIGTHGKHEGHMDLELQPEALKENYQEGETRKKVKKSRKRDAIENDSRANSNPHSIVQKEPAVASIRTHGKHEGPMVLEFQAEALKENSQEGEIRKKVKKSRKRDANENDSKANSNAHSLVQKKPAVASSSTHGKHEGCMDLELQAEALKENDQGGETRKKKVKKSGDRDANENSSSSSSSLLEKEHAVASMSNRRKHGHMELELQAEALKENGQDVETRKKKVKKSQKRDANEDESRANSNAGSLVRKEPAVASTRNHGKHEGCWDLELLSEALKENAREVETRKRKVKKSPNKNAIENSSRADSSSDSLVQKSTASWIPQKLLLRLHFQFNRHSLQEFAVASIRKHGKHAGQGLGLQGEAMRVNEKEAEKIKESAVASIRKHGKHVGHGLELQGEDMRVNEKEAEKIMVKKSSKKDASENSSWVYTNSYSLVQKESAVASTGKHGKHEGHRHLELPAEAFKMNAQEAEVRKTKMKKSRNKDANENSSLDNRGANTLAQKEPEVARIRNNVKHEGQRDLELQAEALKENAQEVETKKRKLKKSVNKVANEGAFITNSGAHSPVQKVSPILALVINAPNRMALEPVVASIRNHGKHERRIDLELVAETLMGLELQAKALLDLELQS
ncbi:hypothetical protein Tsubulata_047354 [Turnera subulata]|uniref:Zinc-finger domain-containing protein n=1 Tax=Turnera subulata TaxID=218843 RepID=A0A9Q0FJJ9_9ROSI|nr:hypothetical protein Tsubulata_047354 [Turnera subulata]